MSNTTQEVLTVDSVNQYGIKYQGKTYSISTLLAKKGVTPESFAVGSRIRAEIWTGPQGGKKINSYQLEGAAAPAPIAAYAPALPPPMLPALPPTTLAATPAPGGVAPVSKTPRTTTPAKDDDHMSKAEWKAKDNAIAIQAIVKSSLESPALGEHVTGKSHAEFLEMTREFVKYNLETYQLALEGKL